LINSGFSFLMMMMMISAAVSCYRIEPGTVAGIICADLLLTLIIVVVTYRCARFKRQKLEKGKAFKLTLHCRQKA
uniref:Hematopoietic cell signal transducer n=1 Tax=Nothobranchius furzeri TaxID=105023 RepID=A0A8C6KLV5_NOTFU